MCALAPTRRTLIPELLMAALEVAVEMPPPPPKESITDRLLRRALAGRTSDRGVRAIVCTCAGLAWAVPVALLIAITAILSEDLALHVNAAPRGPVAAASSPFVNTSNTSSLAVDAELPPPNSPPAAMLCSNQCQFSGDDMCDDGGAGAEYGECLYGTDCADCGPRLDSDPDADGATTGGAGAGGATDALSANYARLNIGSDTFFSAYYNQSAGQILFQIPPTALGVDFVASALLSKADGTEYVYHEPMTNTQLNVFRWELAPNGVDIDLIAPQLAYRRRRNSTITPTGYARGMWSGWLRTLPAVRLNGSYVVDATSWLLSGVVLDGYPRLHGARLAPGARGFASNLGFEVQAHVAPEDVGAPALSLQVHIDLAQLPPLDGTFTPRAADDRVGYWVVHYEDVGSPADASRGGVLAAARRMRCASRARCGAVSVTASTGLYGVAYETSVESTRDDFGLAAGDVRSEKCGRAGVARVGAHVVERECCCYGRPHGQSS